MYGCIMFESIIIVLPPHMTRQTAFQPVSLVQQLASICAIDLNHRGGQEDHHHPHTLLVDISLLAEQSPYSPQYTVLLWVIGMIFRRDLEQ